MPKRNNAIAFKREMDDQANGHESKVLQRKLSRKNRLVNIKNARRQRSSDGTNNEINRTRRRKSLRMLDEPLDTSASSARSTRVADQEPNGTLSEADSQDQLATLFEGLFGKDDENAAQETTSPRNTNSDPAVTRNTGRKGGVTSQDFLGNLLDELLGKDNEHAAQEATRPPNTTSDPVSTRNTGRGSDITESRPKWVLADDSMSKQIEDYQLPLEKRKNWPCLVPDCVRRFTSPSILKCHMMHGHQLKQPDNGFPVKSDRSFYCPWPRCAFEFSNYYNRQGHIARIIKHSNEVQRSRDPKGFWLIHPFHIAGR